MFGINTKTLSGHCTGHQLILLKGRIPLRSKYYILMGHYSYNRDYRKSLTKKKQEKTPQLLKMTDPTDPTDPDPAPRLGSRLRAVLYGVAEWQDRFPPPGGVGGLEFFVDGIHEGKIGGKSQEFLVGFFV